MATELVNVILVSALGGSKDIVGGNIIGVCIYYEICDECLATINGLN